ASALTLFPYSTLFRSELDRRDVEVDVAEHRDLAERLGHAAQADPAGGAHRRPPPLTAPTVRPFTICRCAAKPIAITGSMATSARSEEHTSELQSREKL